MRVIVRMSITTMLTLVLTRDGNVPDVRVILPYGLLNRVLKERRRGWFNGGIPVDQGG